MPWPWSSTSPPASRFAILFPGRTGSSFLVSCLASHPEVAVEGERLVRQPAEWQRRWVADLYDTPRRNPVRCVGFKTKPKDVWDLVEFGAMLRERRVRIIEMRRRNIVKLAVSHLNAKRIHAETGRWNLASDDSALAPLVAAPAALEEAVAICADAQEQVTRFVGTLGLPTLMLDYEDLLEDRASWLGRVCGFLEIEPRALSGTIEKATSDDLRSALANFDELAAHFAGTPLAAHFLT